MAKRKNEPAAVLDLPVSYGNVNIGDKTATVRLSVHRGNLTVTQADKNLCGKRLSGRILARAGNAQAEQEPLPGAEDDTRLDGVFDVKSFNVTSKHIAFGLSFQIESIDLATLGHFAKREGMFTVTEIGDIPEAERNGDHADEE